MGKKLSARRWIYDRGLRALLYEVGMRLPGVCIC